MGLSSYFEKKGDAGIVIFAGKGGLGKTTCSAGLSHYMASKRNRKVLCFSTDPQASLSDIFDRDIFGKGLISVIPQLDVVEIDADRRVADYQEEVKQKIRSMYGLTEIPPEIEEYIDSTSAEPAMYESATYDAMADLVQTACLIVNQVYPKELADAKGGEAVEFRRNRAQMKQKYLDEIRSKFAGKVVAMLPMYPREPRGMDMIEKVSQDLMFGPAL